MHLSTICFSSNKYLDTTILGERTFSSPVVLKLWGAYKLPMPKHPYTIPILPELLRPRQQLLKFLMTSSVPYPSLTLPFKFQIYFH